MAEDAGNTKRTIPSELLLSDKWDKLFERVVVNAGYGLVVGAAASLVLFRGRGYVLCNAPIKPFSLGRGLR